MPKKDIPAESSATSQLRMKSLKELSIQVFVHQLPATISRKKWVIQSEEAVNAVNEITPYMFGTKVALVVGADEKPAWVRKYDKKNFADVDAAIVATQLMLAIHAEGLETTWIGHFDAPALKEKFPEMAEYNLIAIFPIGYAAEDAVPSPLHEKKKDKTEMVKYL